MVRSCNNCQWAIFEDHGYSNYTVEGTDFTCAQRAHPAGTFDRWYGDEHKLNHAVECEHFKEGSPVDIDVEQSALENWRAEFSPTERKTWELHLTFLLLEGKR